MSPSFREPSLALPTPSQRKLLLTAGPILAVVLASPARSAEQPPLGNPDRSGYLAKVGEKVLRLEDALLVAQDAAEQARFEHIEPLGRYRYELFSATIYAREDWIDRHLVDLARRDGLPIPAAVSGAIASGNLRALDRDELSGGFLDGLRSRYQCDLDVPPFRVPLETIGFPRLGSPAAPVTLVEFMDFQCGACARLEPVLQRVVKSYGEQVALVTRHFALSASGAPSFALAEGALCAAEQGQYWPFRETLLSDFGSTLPVRERLTTAAAAASIDLTRYLACLDSRATADRVRKDQEEGALAGVFGVPAVFVNGRRIMGGSPEDALRGLIEKELASGGTRCDRVAK